MSSKNVVVIVAHPDDEILWAGGTILKKQKAWNCYILCLCRGQDEDRAPKFKSILKALGAKGVICNLDDGPEQTPLNKKLLETTIIKNLPAYDLDLVVTHSPRGEYTRHLRHEELGHAIINLWHTGKIETKGLWCFAYEDGNKAYYPRAIIGADFYFPIHELIVRLKRKMLNEIYGLHPTSWEMLACPASEAFWSFTDSLKAFNWLNNRL